MNRYNIFQAIILSFYSGDLYRDVGKNWGIKSFLYLILLLAITWIPAVYLVQHTLKHEYTTTAPKLISQIPILTINDGKIQTPENRPYIISDPDTHKVIGIIDTTGHYQTIEQTDAAVLITQTEVISKPKSYETRTNKLPSSLNMKIDPQVVDGYIKTFLDYAWLLLFILFWLCSLVYRLIQGLLYSLIGKIYAAISHSPLTYGQIMQIEMVAITPAIIVATVLDVFNITFSYEYLSYFILAMIYLFYGIIANKK